MSFDDLMRRQTTARGGMRDFVAPGGPAMWAIAALAVGLLALIV